MPMFGIPLSDKEKEYILSHPDEQPGQLAKMMRNVFKDHNHGRRCRLTVISYRCSDEYKYKLAESKEKRD